MRLAITVLLIGMTIATSLAQTKYEEAIKRDARVFNQALLDGDYSTHVDRMIPSIVTIGGGKESMVSVVKDRVKLLEENEMKIIHLEPEAVGAQYVSENAIHVILGQSRVQQIKDKQFYNMVSYLGESRDGGKTWSFVNLEPYDKASILEFIPDISKDISIPVPGNATEVRE